MGAVFIREFKAILNSIYAVAVATVFSVASGILFLRNNISIAYPSIDAVVSTMSLVAAILIPVVACFRVNGEKKCGSELLLSVLPLTKTQIVLGKFFGIFAFFMIPTGIIFAYPVIAGFFGNPSYGYSYVVLLVFVLFEAFIISMSMAFSAIFKRGWMSAVVTYALLTVLFLLGALSVLFPEFIEIICVKLSPFRQFDPILFGVLDLSSILYFLLLTLLFLAITLRFGYCGNRASKKKKMTAVTAAVALVALVANVGVSILPTNARWIDVSEEKLYAVSATTEQLMDSLDEDVTVYLIDPDRSEQRLLNAIERYCDRSSHITLKKVNTSKDKDFRAKYGLGESENLSYCLVLESAKRWHFVGADSLFVWYNSELGYMSTSKYAETLSQLEMMKNYYSAMSSEEQAQFVTMYNALTTGVTKYMDVENILSAGIEYVTADNIPALYFLSGHGEKNTQDGPLDTKGMTKLPENATLLIMNNPEEDYSAEEVDMLINFMNNGGRMIILTNEKNNSMPNIARLLASAGLSLEPDAVADGASTVTVNTSCEALSLLAGNNKVTLDLIDGDSIVTDESNANLKFTSLYTLDTEVEVEIFDSNGEMQTTTKVETKKLGVAVTNKEEPMLVWVTGADTFNGDKKALTEEEREQYVIAMYGINSFVLWMGKSFESSLDVIKPVAYAPELLAMEQRYVAPIGVLAVGVIPVLILGAGLLRIYSRKKRSGKSEA